MSGPDSPYGEAWREEEERRRHGVLRPESIAVVIGGVALDQLAELYPAVALWAESEGAPPPSPADLVELAIAVLHGQTVGPALVRAQRDREAATKH